MKTGKEVLAPASRGSVASLSRTFDSICPDPIDGRGSIQKQHAPVRLEPVASVNWTSELAHAILKETLWLAMIRQRPGVKGEGIMRGFFQILSVAALVTASVTTSLADQTPAQKKCIRRCHTGMESCIWAVHNHPKPKYSASQCEAYMNACVKNCFRTP